jgi:hypothetical protein
MAEESREELIRKALLANALSAQSKAIDTNVDIAPPVPTDEVPVNIKIHLRELYVLTWQAKAWSL